LLLLLLFTREKIRFNYLLLVAAAAAAAVSAVAVVSSVDDSRILFSWHATQAARGTKTTTPYDATQCDATMQQKN
jgi:hypothetical protein